MLDKTDFYKKGDQAKKYKWHSFCLCICVFNFFMTEVEKEERKIKKGFRNFLRLNLIRKKNRRKEMKKLMKMHNDTISQREKKYLDQLKVEPVAGDIELF